MARHRKREQHAAAGEGEGRLEGCTAEECDRGSRRSTRSWDETPGHEALSATADGAGRKIYYDDWT